MNETVLLTGISGWIAKHTAIELLKSGYKVLEVNGAPAWKGLQNVSDINISDKIIKFLLFKMGELFVE